MQYLVPVAVLHLTLIMFGKWEWCWIVNAALFIATIILQLTLPKEVEEGGTITIHELGG